MLSTPPAFILSQDQTLMLKVYPVQKFLATVFKVAFYKKLFVHLYDDLNFLICELLRYLESFKVIHCSVVNVLCFSAVRCLSDNFYILSKTFVFVKNFFIFLFAVLSNKQA